jgi:hypothetical protein
MLTVFCDLRQFPAKNLALFSKTNVMINLFFGKTGSSFEQKTPIFSPNFSAKIF